MNAALKVNALATTGAFMPTVIQLPPSAEAVFTGAAEWRVPSMADRAAYKKDPGSSDTRHQEDEIRT